jgi:hypothetical protein
VEVDGEPAIRRAQRSRARDVQEDLFGPVAADDYWAAEGETSLRRDL